jgi:ElaB/YqjD/DUF883 family membrane-anchored ribosome-binding protein
MADQTKTDVAALRAEIERLRGDFAKIAGTLHNGAGNGLAELGETIEASTEKVWSEAQRQVQSVGREIKQKPVAYVLAALGAGVLLGVFLNGRRA